MMFKSAKEKEIEKRLLVKKTIANMNKQINALENEKKKYLDAAKLAKQKGLTAQLNLAISALKSTMGQQRRAQEMLLNFEITSSMKDMAQMTSEFLKSMSVVSKEMSKLTNNKDFAKMQKEFEAAMAGAEYQVERMDAFLDMNQSVFADSSIASTVNISDDEILSLIDNTASGADKDIDLIDKELDELKKKLES